MQCELEGCTSTGEDKIAIAKYQVFDGKMPTMTRPAAMCATCLEFAKKCGMIPHKTGKARED